MQRLKNRVERGELVQDGARDDRTSDQRREKIADRQRRNAAQSREYFGRRDGNRLRHTQLSPSVEKTVFQKVAITTTLLRIKSIQ